MPYTKNPISKPPFGGWNDSAPSAVLQASSFRQITNWMIRYNRIHPFFQTSLWAEQSILGSSTLMNARTFTDQQGFIHTFLLTDTGWGEIVPGVAGAPYTITNVPWTAAYPTYTASQLFSVVVFNGQLYFANGAIPLTMFKGDGNVYAVGGNNPNSTPPLIPVGDFPGSAFFLAAFSDRLLALNTVEPYSLLPGSTNFPSTIRYSAVNNGLEWDFTVDTSAGEFIISDAEDALSGWVTINQTGFAFRRNGITAISATGNQLVPFFVENFSVGPNGVGAFLPYCLSAYGTIACFVAQDDVYTFSGGAPQAIGSTARRSIFRDLGTSSSTPFGLMVGSFQFVDYLTYWLVVPQASDTFSSLWIFHFDDKSWINVHWPYGALRSVSNIATA